MKPLVNISQQVTKDWGRNRSRYEVDLIRDWHKIIGTPLYDWCRPLKLSFSAAREPEQQPKPLNRRNQQRNSQLSRETRSSSTNSSTNNDTNSSAFTRRSHGKLTLIVLSGYALDIQQLSPQIIAKVNGYFGYPMIARLSIVQRYHLSSRAVTALPPKLSQAEPEPQPIIQDEDAKIQDPKLRETLQQLRANVRAKVARG